MPNIVTPILVQATYILPGTILSIAFLSYIGVGFVEPTPDWGRMFAIGSEVYEQDPMFMFFPGVALVVFVLAFNLVGDSVRDAFDPRPDAEPSIGGWGKCRPRSDFRTVRQHSWTTNDR
ncbi:hypothetical protein SHIRM173S_06699 [Streptomyces hirsutus]